MADRFSSYDVLAKTDSESWDAITRRIIAERIGLAERQDVLTDRQRLTLRAVIDRVTPQPEGRPPVNAAAILLEKIASEEGDGYRHHRLPPLRVAWLRGLDAIEAEARARQGRAFDTLDGEQQDELLRMIEAGEAHDPAWSDMPPDIFFIWRLIPDIVAAYWSHPSAWSAMGFGGPASPRGYVRLDADRRDPWEGAEDAT
ncbi:gluconate 2-dehydrogenase subunit 3 family protein [Sphingobium sp. Ndbn-10]|uniref:gluconate 2-dehydrogenase subunit 3 family protein n=1 Tax=Sphingobium sp. Ndbn-10 TaxID=1667223 RepID=UPI000818AA36|nr:gluconate 2-dehydrogenase subunit 3 family protein [Sphingobium sp. Ndbn-10]